MPWTYDEFKWVPDANTFLFSLSRREKYALNRYGVEKAVYHHKDYLCAFGGGHDLCIVSNPHKHKNSYANIGHSFALPDKQSDKFVGGAGKYNFKVVDIEVYQVITL